MKMPREDKYWKKLGSSFKEQVERFIFAVMEHKIHFVQDDKWILPNPSHDCWTMIREVLMQDNSEKTVVNKWIYNQVGGLFFIICHRTLFMMQISVM
jgi:hypothetical protein